MKSRDEIFKQFGSLSRRIMRARNSQVTSMVLQALEEMKEVLPKLEGMLRGEYEKELKALSKIGRA